MHRLICHPESRPVAVRGVEARARRDASGVLALRFVLTGELAHIALPAPRLPQRRDELWRHTCFECFMQTGGSAYLEFNFSPSGEWAAYAFRDYRDAEPLPDACDPRIVVTRGPDAIELEAAIPADALTAVPAQWRVGLSAVVEETSGTTTYWALRHAPGKPDFHRDEAFALEL